jgi:putative hydrolase of the HAD superfamily
MIKNIIFDLGNVLISFKPSEYFDNKKYPQTIKTRIISDIFNSREWKLLDNGELTTEEAIDSISTTTSLNKDEIAHIFNLRTEIMFPLDQNVRLLPELKKRGFRIFFLSNFPIDIFEEIKSGYYFFKYFDGGIISSEVKFSKPDIRIYQILLEKYSLIPSECLFIDDLEENVMAAEVAGMKGLITYGSGEISREIENALGQTAGGNSQ